MKFYNYFEETGHWYLRMVSYERRLRELQLLHARRNYIFQNRDLLNAGIQDDHLPFLHRGKLIKLFPLVKVCLFTVSTDT